jgi:ABC-type glycerol-3-phosphate transport system permease component
MNIKKKIVIYLLLIGLLLQPFFITVVSAAETSASVTQAVSESAFSDDSTLSVFTHQNRKAEGLIIIGALVVVFVFMAIQKPLKNAKNSNAKKK